uniref:Uncharacterized protein n=1 Tax=Lygus hesperus TaxID=30085 RepID=A0A0A9W5Q2_LYGHE
MFLKLTCTLSYEVRKAYFMYVSGCTSNKCHSCSKLSLTKYRLRSQSSKRGTHESSVFEEKEKVEHGGTEDGAIHACLSSVSVVVVVAAVDDGVACSNISANLLVVDKLAFGTSS